MPDTVAIIHPNHEGVSVTEVADEVRIAVIQPEGATVSVIYDAGGLTRAARPCGCGAATSTRTRLSRGRTGSSIVGGNLCVSPSA